ncbi:MAG TPA: hypothetical protein DCM28_22490 [Phycisphaerales bacterium]|nr:hypothetical protein [Phycisphaerales bacterium]HCD31725.1 hypothetical protein [Phycisphaerales bacterium]|tara:strand:+ start:87 stop:422 length:336 start_codon:yes stop_codon:yes gene_type:complete
MSAQFMTMLIIAICGVLTLCSTAFVRQSNWHKTAFAFFILAWTCTLFSLYDSGPLPSNTLEETNHLLAVSRLNILFSLVGFGLALVSCSIFLFATHRSRLADHSGCQSIAN